MDRAVENQITVVYIKHNNLSAGTRTFKPDTSGAELVSDMRIVSEHIFLQTKGNALTCEAFADFISKNENTTEILGIKMQYNQRKHIEPNGMQIP